MAFRECREASPGTGSSYNWSHFSYPFFWRAKKQLSLMGTNISLSKHARTFRWLFLPTTLQSRAGLQRGSASASWEMSTLGGWPWRWGMVEWGCMEVNLNGNQLTSIRKGGFLRSWEASACKRLGTGVKVSLIHICTYFSNNLNSVFFHYSLYTCL